VSDPSPMPVPDPLPDNALDVLDVLEERMARDVLMDARRNMGALLAQLDVAPMRVLDLLDMLLTQTRTRLETLGYPTDVDHADGDNRRARRAVRAGGVQGVMGRAVGAGVLPRPGGMDMPYAVTDMVSMLREHTNVARLQGLLSARLKAAAVGDAVTKKWAQEQIDQITGRAGEGEGVEASAREPEIDAEFGDGPVGSILRDLGPNGMPIVVVHMADTDTDTDTNPGEDA